MESNDNGGLPRSADPETPFPPPGPIWQKPRQENSPLRKTGFSGSRLFLKASARRLSRRRPLLASARCQPEVGSERTSIPEDQLLRRTVVTNEFPRSGLVQCFLCRARHSRHTFASDMVRAGVSLPALMQLMGHAQIQTTMVYVRVTPLEVYQQYARAVAQHIRPVPGTRS
jgi:hypothetical protein